jgi:hypothetical protein
MKLPRSAVLFSLVSSLALFTTIAGAQSANNIVGYPGSVGATAEAAAAGCDCLATITVAPPGSPPTNTGSTIVNIGTVNSYPQQYTTQSGGPFSSSTQQPIPCTQISNYQLSCKSDAIQRATQMWNTSKANYAQQACGMHMPSGSTFRVYYQVAGGTRTFATQLGTLTSQQAQQQTTCNCPQGWLSNTNGQDGGVTMDNKCKKMVGTITLNPPPPNTNLGTWGFSVGPAIWAWGSQSNGGAPNCNTTTSGQTVCTAQ